MAEGMGPWLRPGTTEDQQAALPRLGEVLREYWAAHHLTQASLAGLLGVDQTYVSMIERSRRTIRDIGLWLRVWVRRVSRGHREVGCGWSQAGFAAGDLGVLAWWVRSGMAGVVFARRGGWS
jgi:Helix-turn-helix